MKCEISQSPMISYRSLLFIATTINDDYCQPLILIKAQKLCPICGHNCQYNALTYVAKED